MGRERGSLLFFQDGSNRVIDHPKLRPVEAILAGGEQICLRDPEGFAGRLVLVSPAVFYLLTLFDGEHSVLDLQEAFTRRFGELLFAEKIQAIIEQLDRCLLLDSPRFREARREAVEAFRAAPVREATHAGTAYEGEPAALRAQLDAYFRAPDGPGARAGGGPAGPLRALIAPHIDPRRGGPAYAWSYAELARDPTVKDRQVCGARARTFVVLGISHAPTRHRYVLTAKDFATPLGTARTDRDFVSRLAGRLDTDYFADEFVHRGEHSIEFQVLFLQHLLGGEPDLRIVPILCSSFSSPDEDEEVRQFLPALKALIDERGQDVCLIAGVDLSHVGQRFGQAVKMTPGFLRQLEAKDRALLERVTERDAEGFFRRVREEGDATNVCGVPAIYALLCLLGPAGGAGTGGARLLHYGQAVDESTQSVVSFAAAAFRD